IANRSTPASVPEVDPACFSVSGTLLRSVTITVRRKATRSVVSHRREPSTASAAEPARSHFPRRAPGHRLGRSAIFCRHDEVEEVMTNREWAEKAGRVLVGNYKQQPIAVERGEGCYLYDVEGNRYLDMIAGISTVSLGHCHPRLVKALQGQAEKLWHASNVVHSLPPVELAERICAHSFAERVFFRNCGAEADEAALKLARRWPRSQGRGRLEILAFERSFHGRTLFTVSATGQPKYWEGFEPMVPGIVHARFNDLDSVREKISAQTAAILVEPI